MKRTLPTAIALLLAACTLPNLPSLPGGPTSTPGPAPTAVPDPNTPEGTAAAFMTAWAEDNYEAMYALTTSNYQAQYPIEAFSGVYTAAAEEMRLVDLEVNLNTEDAESTPQTSLIPYHVTYFTASLGAIEQDLQMSLVKEGEEWRVLWSPQMIFPELVRGNSLDLTLQSPTRANIYDRNGNWLVQSDSETYTISVIPSLVGDENDEARMLDLLSEVLRMSPAAIQLQYSGYPEGYSQAVAVGDADAEVVDDVYPQVYRYEAVQVSNAKLNRRNYWNLAPHILGYTSLIPAEDIVAYRAQGYADDDIVGIDGIERAMEQYLAGTRGGILAAYTRTGEYYSEVYSRDSQPALNVYTTLDRDLQTIVQDAIEDAYAAGSATWSPTAGGAAVIVMDVNSGQILAIASYPYFDPNVLHPANGNPLFSDNYLNALGADPRRPYFNRATQGAFPPGSVFKIITAAAALGSGEFTPETEYTCTGAWRNQDNRQDWKEEGHGTINLIQAITGSCNPYFFEIGFVTGNVDAFILPNYARDFGLGRLTGIEIEEEPGQVPDPDWMLENKGQEWSVDDSMNLAVGQGDLLVTPLQMVIAVAAIANGGTLYKPYLVQAIGPTIDAPVHVTRSEVTGTLPITPDEILTIQEGMRGVVSIIDEGTAENRLGSMGITSAGKTGTAQVSAQGAQPIAWFGGYVPYEEPEIAVIVMVENGGQGSTIAAPIFRRIIERWYDLRVLDYPEDWFDPELYEAVKDFSE